MERKRKKKRTKAGLHPEELNNRGVPGWCGNMGGAGLEGIQCEVPTRHPRRSDSNSQTQGRVWSLARLSANNQASVNKVQRAEGCKGCDLGSQIGRLSWV